jgi:hypothetical protein
MTSNDHQMDSSQNRRLQALKSILRGVDLAGPAEPTNVKPFRRPVSHDHPSLYRK